MDEKFIQIVVVDTGTFSSLYVLDKDGNVWRYHGDRIGWVKLNMNRSEIRQ